MYRDFSEKSRNELLGLVSQVENEKISNFTDWVGDRWYDFESWIGKLNIRNYLNNVNKYHKKVIDKNNATKSSINTIFNKVKSVDASYKNTFSSKKSQLQQWQRYIDELSQIVNPRNGRFNAKAMSDALDGLLKQLAMDELNSSLEEYVELDKTTQKYTYHWNEIEKLFTKDTYSMTDTDYQVLLFILSTMADEKGKITDVENLQKFINAGYTIPSQVTANDFHESFEKLPNGQKMSYYYIQNKSYMSDTLKVICAKYSELCNLSGNQSDLNTLMQSIAENYSVIEWRQKLDYTNAIVFTQMEQDVWSGERKISQEVLNKFNEMCKPNISLELVNEKGDKSGIKYFKITSNSANFGDVRTANSDGQFIKRNDVEVDGYTDCTLRVYIGCENLNADVVAVVQQGRSLLGEYYQEFDWQQVLTDELVNLVGRIPLVGDYVSSIYDVATQTEAISAVSSGLDGIKSSDLGDFTNISKKTENRIDEGISTINQGIGIYTKYKATEANNLTVEENQEKLQEFANPLYEKTNLGYVYDTMIIRYEHCSYEDNGTGIKVDESRDCNKSSCVVSPSDYHYDSDTLLKQYKSIMNKPDNFSKDDSEFLELEKQISEYIATGKLEEDSYLANYIKEW